MWRGWQALLTESVSLRSAVAGVTAVALAVFVLTPAAKVPTFNPDPFHFGETFIPWRQLVDFGQVPYVDLVPIHGLMDLLRGFLNEVFFDGTAASFPLAELLLMGLAVSATFVGIYHFAGAGACLPLVFINPLGELMLPRGRWESLPCTCGRRWRLAGWCRRPS